MADYQPLLAKLVDGLGDAAARQEVYDRARAALAEQLRTVEPPLEAEEVDRERGLLEDAVRTVEAEAERTPVLPRLPEAPAVDARDEPVRPSAARRDRPAAETPVIRRGGRRRVPTGLLASLTLLAVPVAVVAWFWREPARQAVPADGAPTVAETRPVPQPDLKFGERVAGGGAQQPPASAPRPASPAQRPQAATPTANAGAPALAVAQRALLFEENQLDPQKPTVAAGSAIWRLEQLPAGQGLPLENVVRGAIDFPGAGLTLLIVLRRNADAALPASHTIEMSFTSANGSRVVRDVALPQMRPEEAIRGVPLAGLPVPVKENIFLIGLSDLKGDIERNTELLLRRNWMEIPIRFASGQKAALLLDKGVSGDRVFQDAFRQWGQAP